MDSEVTTVQRSHPWWQRRLSTARKSTAFAVTFSVLAAAWIVVYVLPVFARDYSGPPAVLVAIIALVWVLIAAPQVVGALAQRREERAALRAEVRLALLPRTMAQV